MPSRPPASPPYRGPERRKWPRVLPRSDVCRRVTLDESGPAAVLAARDVSACGVGLVLGGPVTPGDYGWVEFFDTDLTFRLTRHLRAVHARTLPNGACVAGFRFARRLSERQLRRLVALPRRS